MFYPSDILKPKICICDRQSKIKNRYYSRCAAPFGLSRLYCSTNIIGALHLNTNQGFNFTLIERIINTLYIMKAALAVEIFVAKVVPCILSCVSCGNIGFLKAPSPNIAYPNELTITILFPLLLYFNLLICLFANS